MKPFNWLNVLRENSRGAFFCSLPKYIEKKNYVSKELPERQRRKGKRRSTERRTGKRRLKRKIKREKERDGFPAICGR